MSSRVVSPVFAGRETELAMLAAAFDRAASGTPASVLIGGEAGAGKSRLVSEFVTAAKESAGPGGVLVLSGGCLEMSGAGPLYAPFTAAVRQLTRDLGTAEVAALLPSRAAGDLARLLPEFGEPAADPDVDSARARLFEEILTLLERLADRAPVILVVEDAHWADRSTRDLLSFLLRNLRTARVLTLVTFRSDELHRTHPVRPLLAELCRLQHVSRCDLPRLQRAEVAIQLAGILGRSPDPAAVDAAHARTDGIPLFVEAIVNDDGTVSCCLPESLRDLLLDSVNRLPADTQQVLRIASAGSGRIGHGLLAAVSQLPEQQLLSALRPAVAANVLVSRGDGYEFRHELIREAVHDDLLPGEHAQVHRAFAEVIERDPALLTAGRPALHLAVHWQCAHEHQRALLAAWRAAAEAESAYAYAEQLQMLEQVLELWDQVPDAPRQLGTDHAGVVDRAAGAAYLAGETERGIRLARAALSELAGTADTERVALLHLRCAMLGRQRGQAGYLEEMRTALRLAPAVSWARARILSNVCQVLMVEGSPGETQALAAQARDLARQLGDEVIETDTLITLAVSTGQAGGDAVPPLEEALAKAEQIGAESLTTRCLINLSDALETRGRHERAAEVAAEGFQRSKENGRARIHGAFLASNCAESLISLGRWDEAADVLGEGFDLNPPWPLRSFLLLQAARIALARGEREKAAQTVDALQARIDDGRDDTQHVLPLAQLVVGSRIAEGDVAGALAAAARAAAGLSRHVVRPRYVWPLLVTAMSACAMATSAGHVARQEETRRNMADLTETLRQCASALGEAGPVERAHHAAFMAEAARADCGQPGRAASQAVSQTAASEAAASQVAAWRSVAEQWEALGQPYPLAYALLRAGEAAATMGDRSAAARHLRRAAELARGLGARPLLGDVADLAQRARISLADPGDPGHQARAEPGTSHGLTRRELEVLRLVAEGRSNREIAAELFISAKTASVHVSNILAKLGVMSRGEASAAAHRLGLLDAPV